MITVGWVDVFDEAIFLTILQNIMESENYILRLEDLVYNYTVIYGQIAELIGLCLRKF